MRRCATSFVFIAALSCALVAPRSARAQCMLANPSFEIGGQSGAIFGGWNQFGSVGSSSSATHGAVAARVSGPNTGTWDVSGYWQSLDSTPGDTWAVAGDVRIPSARPLAGQSAAIVNVEWRNSGGALISYESHTVATAATPSDTSLHFTFTTGPAPAGTTAARVLLGVLQGPGDPQRDAIYDRITFVKQTTPSIDALQWGDFGGGRTLSFSGRTWRVKGTGYYGPGPNLFSDSPNSVWVDDNGALHLTIAFLVNGWYSSEVALVDPLGYGDYVFTARGRLDTFDPTTVFGLFVWEYGPCYDTSFLWWNPYNEIDVEFSRWGVAGSPDAQFVAQPADWGGNRHRFAASFADDEVTTHAFRWRPDRVEFRSWRGGVTAESPATLIQSWTYTGPHVPRPDQPRVHLNMWQVNGAPATHQEAVIDGFHFTPWPAPPVAVEGSAAAPGAPLALALASRNPASGTVGLRCTLARAGEARIVVYDLAGRVVRTLVDGTLAAGTHPVTWDGRDRAGRRAPAGVYLCQLSSGGASVTARVVRLP